MKCIISLMFKKRPSNNKSFFVSCFYRVYYKFFTRSMSHVSVKQIANIEKGKMNPSYLILRALAKVLHISLDTLINPDVSLEDEGVNQMKMLYSSCPPEMRDTLLHHTQETVKELTELSKKFETNWASEWNLTILSLVLFIFREKRQAIRVFSKEQFL